MAQLNSLLVIGDSRFLNTINGDINGNAATASKLEGTYSGSGGQQPPSYFGRNKVGALMSNATVNGDSHFKNWLYMDNYNGTDVGGATAIGVDRTEARAFIMQSDANRTAWNNTAELATTTYVTNQIGALDGVITGSAGAGKTLTAFSQTNGVVTATFGNISITKSQISDFPTIPAAANNGQINIKIGSTTAAFTANQSGNKTATISLSAGTTPSTVTKKTVVTGCTKKTVVTDATFNTVVNAVNFNNGVLSFGTGVSGTKTTGDSCTVTTGDSVTVTAGTAPSLSMTVS